MAIRARIVKSKTEVVEQRIEEVIENGVTFIKNIHPAEILKLKDGSKFKFPTTTYTTNDENEVESLIELAKSGNHGILIVEQPEPEKLETETEAQ